MAAPDELYSLRNYFHVGNYSMAISEGANIRPSTDQDRILRDFYVYRSYIAMGEYNVALEEIKDATDTPVALTAAKLLAQYLSNSASRETILATLQTWLYDESSCNNAELQTIAAIIYTHEQDFTSALKALRNKSTLEQNAMTVQLLLRLDRIDLAKGIVKTLTQNDDEAALTQLARAWVALKNGAEACNDAKMIFTDLRERFGGSPILSNGLAAALMALGMFVEAENVLLDDETIDKNDPMYLLNLLACAQHTNKPASLIQQYLSTLKQKHPDHPFVKQNELFESSFERNSAMFKL